MSILFNQPSGNIRRWNKSAIDCYNRHCVCEGCEYLEYFRNGDSECKMKSAVLALVRIIGTPEEKDL